MSTNFDKETVIGKILTKIFDQANVSDTDRKTVSQALEKRLTERPFRVAVIANLEWANQRHSTRCSVYQTMYRTLQRALPRLQKKSSL